MRMDQVQNPEPPKRCCLADVIYLKIAKQHPLDITGLYLVNTKIEHDIEIEDR